ncbi:T20D4.11-like domain-containing protein [Caenorhabditis elegans]|uniref:T20D4.11-like domain-containing protein n=1 Tax=Caenorhabditis elegans TaxID=6239 RepID=Q2L6V7_CAEEL|nr:DUF19 domain-containing protein [Caenorhabditis elegans]CCD62939.1 DUF19 domain-containing protein [Caenorhabditis elegans]|eukprot:NP_503951.2 Uncharacterized protein CELE_T20D4.10 [Caenorhabditis elegans]
MIGFLKLAIIGTVFLGVAHKAVATGAEDAGCTDGESLRAFSCIMGLSDFIKKTDNLDMNDKKELKVFKDDCHNVISCFNKIKCLGTDGEKIPEMKVVIKYCKAMDYVHDDFAACSDKLNAKKSKCFDDWDPMPDKLQDETDPIKVAKSRSETCKRYFGKDDCMMKEVKETCGQQEWDSFRKHFITIAGGFVDTTCDFSRFN